MPDTELPMSLKIMLDTYVLPAIINNTPPIMTPPGNSNTDISQVINTSNVIKLS